MQVLMIALDPSGHHWIHAEGGVADSVQDVQTLPQLFHQLRVLQVSNHSGRWMS